MTTRKQLITERYGNLEVELKKYFDNELFPSLDSIDIADLVYFITMIFMGISTVENYDKKIKELLSTHNITVTENTYVKIFPLIMNFVVWFKDL